MAPLPIMIGATIAPAGALNSCYPMPKSPVNRELERRSSSELDTLLKNPEVGAELAETRRQRVAWR